jgi:HK97 family phage portal protein
MGVLTSVKERRSSLANPDARLLRLFGVVESAAGIAVNEKTALTLAAWWACVQVISEDVSTMPLLTYRRLSPKGKERAVDHSLYDVLHTEPNPEMGTMTFRQTLTAHCCSWGNAYAEIEFTRGGDVKYLWPLRPDHMTPARRDGRVQYEYILPNGKGVILPPERILHLRGLSFDGLKGYSPTRMAMETVGLALAAERFGASLFKNNARPGGYLKHPNNLSKEAQDRLIKDWEERAKGLDNAHRISVLEEGMEFQEVGMPPEEVEFLTTRQHQVEDVCRWHRMQPHKIQHLLRSTFSNIEHQSIEHWSDTIQPWCTRWEEEITRKCFSKQERQMFFVEHLPDSILKTDTKGRYDAYAVGRQWGWLSANDIRQRENMNPVDGGDEYLVPLNMIPASSVRAIPPGGERALPPVEERSLETRAAGEVRRRLSEAYRGVFEQAFRRIIKRERSDILKGAQTHLVTRDAQSFVDWARVYYDELREGGFIGNELWGLYHAFGEAIQAEAASEVGGVAGMTPEMETFMRAYVQKYVDRHVGISMSDILEAIGKPDGDPLDLLTLDLDKWDSRPEIEAQWETHRAANAVARETFWASGVTRLRWQAIGDSCPYCLHLNGKIVGIDAAFVHKGEHLNDPDNPEKWMSFSSDYFHPPVHGGCDCQVVAA